MNRVYVVGIGPGAGKQMTEEAREVLNACDTIIGYTVYVDLVKEQFPEKEFLTTPMKQEVKRCKMAFEEAMKGKKVAMICSGDAGVYGMAGLMYEVGVEFPKAELEIVPGITAAIGGAAVLGAPLIHDFAVRASAMADFVICLYNPSSRKRHDYLEKACNMMLEYKAEDTICGIVRQIGRDGQESRILTLKELKDTEVDMFTTVFIGNEQTQEMDGHMVTPRGYRDV